MPNQTSASARYAMSAALCLFAAALQFACSPATERQAAKGPETLSQRVVYGDESRTDYYASENETLRRITREAIAAPMSESRLDRTDPGDIQISGGRYGERYNLCEGEAFFDQITAAGCSATLIDDDLLLTAGHCINPDDCTSIRYVFDFYYAAEGELETISEDDVYACEDVVAWQNSDGFDFAIVRVDRDVVGRVPVPVTTSEAALEVETPVWMIGFGAGLPAKLDDGGRVVNSGDVDYPIRFNATVDAFGGNSGSGVFDESGTVVGILVAGQRDFTETEDGCSIVNVIAEDSGVGESIVYARRAVERLCSHGYESDRLCPTGELTFCARCETNDDCATGFSCTRDERSSVSRCAAECDTDDACRPDHHCDASLCVPNWGTVCRDGDSHWRSACAEEAGVADECAELEYCGGGECTPRVEGDLCANAIAIDAVSATLTGSTDDGARDDYASGDCDDDNHDLVYAFTLEEEQFIWARATGYDTVLYLRSTDCSGGDLVDCNDDAPDLDGGSELGAVLEPGTHYLFVDGDGARGDFEVDFRVLRPCDATCFVDTVECSSETESVRRCVAGDDTCPVWEDTLVCEAGEICFDEGCITRDPGDHCANALTLEPITQTLTGTLNPETRGDYRGSCAGNGRELVYEMEVVEAIRWRAIATGFDTVVYVREATCDDADAEVACNDDSGAVPGRGSLVNAVLEPGMYYVFVDAYGSGATGEFELDIEISCPYDCETDEVQCVDGTVSTCVVPEGDECPYWDEVAECAWTEVCIEGACAERAPGDACINAERIDFEDQTIVGSTRDGYLDDYRGSCAGSGPDRVYSMRVDETSTITATATGFDTVLYIRTRCAESESEVACNDDGGGLPGYGSLLEATLEPGLHYLFVDAYNSDVAEFTLELDVEPVGCADCDDVGVDTGDVAPDVRDDVGVDVSEDVGVDAETDSTDVAPDAAPDVDAGDVAADTPIADTADVPVYDVGTDPDADSTDATPDVIPDTATDAAPDTEPDTGTPDAEPDAGVEADSTDTPPLEDVSPDSVSDSAETDATPARRRGGCQSIPGRPHPGAPVSLVLLGLLGTMRRR